MKEIKTKYQNDANIENILFYIATVPTGLEWVAIREIEKVYKISNLLYSRGKVYFYIIYHFQVNEVGGEKNDVPPSPLLLRTIDRVHLLLFVSDHISKELDEAKQSIYSILKNEINWDLSINVWRQEVKEEKKEIDFRVTCYRSGDQNYSSMDVAKHCGGFFRDLIPNWHINLSHYQAEFIIYINEEDAIMICLTLTNTRISIRNIFDRCGRVLRPSISYSLCTIALQYWRSAQINLRLDLNGDDELANIQLERELVSSTNLLLDDSLFPSLAIDPMCGAGTIAIEWCAGWPMKSDWKCGDNNLKIVKKCKTNLTLLSFPHSIDVLLWDATSLPLPSHSVDLIVSDLPFGKRHGSKKSNEMIYPQLISEWSRVLKVGGIAVVLTLEKELTKRLLRHHHHSFVIQRVQYVNVGNIYPLLFVLRRRNL